MSSADLTKYDTSSLEWFPSKMSDLDLCSSVDTSFYDESDSHRPELQDQVYVERRKYFTKLANGYRHGQEIPRVEYTDVERDTWRIVYQKLTDLHSAYACQEYLESFELLKSNCGFSESKIPQLEDVSSFLRQRTGFSLRPVPGYLTPRNFLYGLAFKVFNCSQYIRHQSDPFYSTEPDICHDLIGHVPMFANPDFASFSNEIGLASIGASDEDINKLVNCYFFTVEFGLCKQDDELKVYGAGLLSSASELEHALSDKAVRLGFEPAEVVKQECQLKTYQNAYYVSNKFEEATAKIRAYSCQFERPYSVEYDEQNLALRIAKRVENEP